MAQIIAIYAPPADPAAFDKYYWETHIPLAKQIPRLRSCVVTTSTPKVLAGNPVHLMAQLTFDSMADLEAALASPEGQATAADLVNFAQAGVTLLIVETATV